jgi:hypothetical protein
MGGDDEQGRRREGKDRLSMAAMVEIDKSITVHELSAAHVLW